jgi:hypothetical protein
MRRGERGFSTLELIVGLGISVIIGMAAVGATGQIWNSSGSGGEYIGAVNQVQNAERWLSRDSRVAEAVITDNLTGSEFLVLSWTEYDYGETDDIYHSVTYSFSGLSQNVGDLLRTHWDSATGDTVTLVARQIYYNAADPDGTSTVTQQDGVLYIKLVGRYGDTSETREFHLTGRPELWQW